MGGQWLAIRAPERLKRLVLSNTAAHLEPAAYFDDLVAQTLASHDLEAMADMFMGNWFPAEMFDSRPQTIAEFRVKHPDAPGRPHAQCRAIRRVRAGRERFSTGEPTPAKEPGCPGARRYAAVACR